MTRIRKLMLAGSMAAFMAAGVGAGAYAAQSAAPSATVAAAVSDSRRPDADRARDADRKPAQTVAFAGVKPGDKVAELNPGGGYYTRILAATVGPKGKVYAMTPANTNPARMESLKAIAAAYGNVEIVTGSYVEAKLPEPVDVVWTTENYHDFKNQNPDMAVFNRAMLANLKPGGTYYVQDHNAKAGSPANVTSTLHRVEAATVKSELIGAGFRVEAEGDALRNTSDAGDQRVFEGAVQGKTDKFMIRARKPA